MDPDTRISAGTRRRRPLILAGLCLLVVVLVCDSEIRATTPEDAKLVIMFYPEANDGSPGSALADRGIRTTFARHTTPHFAIEIHSEYLDVSRYSDAAYQQELTRFLRRKYAGRKIHLVIAGLSSALDYVTKYRQDLFPGVPIIFCAVDKTELAQRRLAPDIIGAPMNMDLAASLDLALQLHPKTERVLVVAGKSKFDASWEAQARQRFQRYAGRLEISYATGLPMADLLQKVATLPERSVIYYLHVFEDGTGKVLIPADVLEQIASRANAPIYSHVDSYIGRGIVGGRVFSFAAEGQRAAMIGLRILAGERPDNIGIQDGVENQYVFDGRQLERWGISQASLPPGSIVRHKTPSLWQLYQWRITGVIAVCVIQGLLITALIIQRYRRARAERCFRQTVDAAPTGMLMVGQGGEIVLVNQQIERLFGHPNEELVGQNVEMLVPERIRREQAILRRVFFAARDPQPMGIKRELFGLRKDGSEFPIEVTFSPIQLEHGLFILASVVDITERRHAEKGLQETQQQLRQLTGRLMEAQEAERGRIARELHDDVGQTLALLSVEMDRLHQQPPETSAQLGRQMEEMLARLKQLSSSIHDLSHRLHPMKLEQLGLVTAVRGLCKELSQSYGVDIVFVPDQVPNALSKEVALCLYRLAQEALRNVFKHSQARRATVELRGDAGAVCLRICDNGTGFDPAAASRNGGLGFASMRERLRLVSGEIAIRSQVSQGTQIEARVPLSATTSAEVECSENSVCAQ